MCLGEVREVVIPPHLHYGWKGVKDYIPSHATLHYTLKLSKLEKPAFRSEVLKAPPASCDQQVVAGSTVTVHYSTYVIGGNFKKSEKPELLDSSTGREPWGPFVFEESTDIVTGLRMGIEGMCVGEKRRMIVPPELAWGDGLEGYVRGKASIIFLVELMSLQWPAGFKDSLNVKDEV